MRGKDAALVDGARGEWDCRALDVSMLEVLREHTSQTRAQGCGAGRMKKRPSFERRIRVHAMAEDGAQVIRAWLALVAAVKTPHVVRPALVAIGGLFHRALQLDRCFNYIGIRVSERRSPGCSYKRVRDAG